MDNNQQPVTPTQPVSTPSPIRAENKKGGIVMWVVVVLVAVLVIGGVVFWYLNNQSKVPVEGTPGQQTEDLTTELDSLVEEDLEADFTSLDQDLQNL